MFKKIIFLLVVLFLFSRSHLVFASPVINELMYDLDGADTDWVEVYNEGSEDIDLTSFNLLISNSTSNHGIVKHSGSSILHSGDYGVIVSSSDITDFINKWGSGDNIFTASFSLSNDTEKVEINNGDKNSPLSSVTYSSSQGASGDGNSLQLINGSWVAASPTPGSVNKISSSTPTSSQSTGGGTAIISETNNNTIEPKKKEKVVEIPSIKTKITASHLVYVGLPVELKSSATGLSNESLYYGKYFWNFGDGDSKEISNTEKFTHTYDYPGEYIVSLEYYTNTYSQNFDATDKIIIKVVPVQIVISKVGDEKDFFVELTNNSDYEIDLSKWILSSGNKNFIFPKNSIVMPKKNITLSSKITQFIISDANSLKLITPTGEVTFDYGTTLLPTEVQEQNVTTTNLVKDKNQNSTQTVSVSKTKVPIKNLSASVVENSVILSDSNHSYLLIVGLIILLVLSGASVYFLRRNKVVSSVGEDFEILDE